MGRQYARFNIPAVEIWVILETRTLAETNLTVTQLRSSFHCFLRLFTATNVQRIEAPLGLAGQIQLLTLYLKAGLWCRLRAQIQVVLTELLRLSSCPNYWITELCYDRTTATVIPWAPSCTHGRVGFSGRASMHTVMLGRMLFIHKTLGGLKLLMLGPFCLVHLKWSSYNIFGYNSSGRRQISQNKVLIKYMSWGEICDYKTDINDEEVSYRCIKSLSTRRARNVQNEWGAILQRLTLFDFTALVS